MPAEWDATTRQLHLHNRHLSYVLRVLENGMLGHLHFGAPLAPGRSYAHLCPVPFTGFSNRLDCPVALEMPTPGLGDFRVPGLVAEQSDGSSVLDLRYLEHRITPGKAALEGLPSTYVEREDEATTVEVRLVDELTSTQVDLSFTIFEFRPLIARHARIRNRGHAPIRIRCAMSAVLDLADADWEAVQLSGSWAREFQVTEHRLVPGRHGISSIRGASGHEHNPFLALRRSWTTEDAGEAIGTSLVYSGNFLVETEVGQFGTARVRLGINPDGFAWTLDPSFEFTTPEAVLTYSSHGLGNLSDALHRLFRERLARGPWRDRIRPIVLNSWEAAYFDVTESRLLEIAAAARGLGWSSSCLTMDGSGAVTMTPPRSGTGSPTSASCRTAWTELPTGSSTWASSSVSGSSRRW